MSTTTEKCRGCGQFRPLAELLRVEPVDGAPVFWVHRPNTNATCFRVAVGSRARHRLFLAEPPGVPA